MGQDDVIFGGGVCHDIRARGVWFADGSSVSRLDAR